MDGISRSAAAIALGVLTGSFAVALAADSGTCTVRTADRTATPVAACTACHGAARRDGERSTFQMPGNGFTHPVDVDLDAVRSASPGRYASREQLPEFLPLANGKITCMTCHDGRAGHPHALARASQREMCLGCHQM
jgi:predicted CXXCH cytochrome family protein